MQKVVSVLCLSPSVGEVVRDAVAALNRCQGRFVFQAAPEAVALPPPDLQFGYRSAPGAVDPSDPNVRDGYSWDLLADVLCRKRAETGARYLLGVLDRPIEHNWFSRVAHPHPVGFVTAAGWE